MNIDTFPNSDSDDIDDITPNVSITATGVDFTEIVTGTAAASEQQNLISDLAISQKIENGFEV